MGDKGLGSWRSLAEAQKKKFEYNMTRVFRQEQQGPAGAFSNEDGKNYHPLRAGKIKNPGSVENAGAQKQLRVKE